MMIFKAVMFFSLASILILTGCDASKRKDLTELNESFGMHPSIDQKMKKERDETSLTFPNTTEFILADLNQDGMEDSIFLKDRPDGVEPGEFRTILIRFANGKEYIQRTSISWDFISPTALKNVKNEIESDRAILLSDRYGKLLFVFGYKLSCCPRNLCIIRITKTRAYSLFNRNLEVEFLGDLDGDGIIDLCGRNTVIKHYDYVHNINADIGTYVPFLFYNLTDKLVLREDLTEDYNLKHYVFHGLHTNEQIKIVYPREGKAFLFQEL